MRTWFSDKKTIILLFLIFFLALFLRLYKLGSLPFNFHEDEVLSGYVGRFILQNGKDLYGNPWPLLYFNKFGDYYIILPMYLAGLSTYLFGVNEFATRFPIALIASLTVFPIFILSFWTFRNKTAALLASLVIAITPWHIVLSRSTTEGIIGSSVYLSGIVVLLSAVKKQNIGHLIISSLLFLLSYLIYHPFRVYVPLTFLPVFVLFNSLKQNKKFLYSLILFTLVFFSLTFYIGRTPWGKGRFVQTSIFSPISGVTIKINQLIFQEPGNSNIKARIFHNKPVGYSREFINQYLTYFSPIYLFVNGWLRSRYAVPEQGPLFILFLVFLFFAFIPIGSKNAIKADKKIVALLIYLILISVVPAATTVVESPNVHRSAFMVLPLSIFIALGLYKTFQLKSWKILLPISLCFLLSIEFVYFWHQYSTHSDLFNSDVRNDGQKQVGIFAGKMEKNYDQVILPTEGAMSLYYLYFNNDFNPVYASQFKLDARIPSTNKTVYIENSCPSQIVKGEDLDKNILIIDKGDYKCVKDDRFRYLDKIIGVNEQLGYKALVPRR
jgi:4-amino-4-deoxy-L-arabinose transferase-like glycosyltransferase